MSYAAAAALQAAVYQRLAGDAAIAALVGAAVYDEVPAGALPALYVALGPEDARDGSDKAAGGAVHRFAVSVIHTGAGFAAAKDVAAAVCDALVDAPLSLSRGTLVGLRFDRARARKVQAQDERRIDLTFRAFIDLN